MVVLILNGKFMNRSINYASLKDHPEVSLYKEIKILKYPEVLVEACHANIDFKIQLWKYKNKQ